MKELELKKKEDEIEHDKLEKQIDEKYKIKENELNKIINVEDQTVTEVFNPFNMPHLK